MTEEHRERPQDEAEKDDESIRDLEVEEGAEEVTGGRKAGGIQEDY
jgi:hypothetical protein